MAAILLTVAVVMMAAASAVGADCRGDDDSGRARAALSRARRLAALGPGVHVRLVDPDLAADPDAVRGLDAFVVREAGGDLRPVIFVNSRSPLVERAISGGEVDVIALAAVLHHEAQHLAGASEAGARRAETAFFKAAVRRARLAGATADDYLRLLAWRDARREAHATQD